MLSKSSGSVRVFYPRYNREKLLQLLQSRLPSLKAALPLMEMWLFGSYAKGTQTPSSDIDLLIVYEGARDEEAYKKAYYALNIRGVQLHMYSHEELHKLQGLKPNPIRIMLEGAVKIL